MTNGFKDSLPSELVAHVTSMCGSKGVKWLDELGDVVRELEQSWSLKVLEPFPAGEFNFVAPSVRDDGELAVLKISPPFESIEIVGEAAFLRSRNGDGTVRLIAEDMGRRAILIEHAVPGKNLAELFTDDPSQSLGPAIEVLRSILSPPPASSEIKTLDEWFDGMRRKHPPTSFPSGYASKALNIYEDLSRDSDRTFYLHGDFHPGNIVSATRKPFLAIDPKGIIGHIGYEIAVFLNNFHWWQETRSDVRPRLDNAVTQFSDAFDIDPFELRQWAFAQMVLGAWWTFEDMPEIYAGEVAKADVWDV
jgi:streptomycin 6-kinase